MHDVTTLTIERTLCGWQTSMVAGICLHPLDLFFSQWKKSTGLRFPVCGSITRLSAFDLVCEAYNVWSCRCPVKSINLSLLSSQSSCGSRETCWLRRQQSVRKPEALLPRWPLSCWAAANATSYKPRPTCVWLCTASNIHAMVRMRTVTSYQKLQVYLQRAHVAASGPGTPAADACMLARCSRGEGTHTLLTPCGCCQARPSSAALGLMVSAPTLAT